MFSNAAFFGLLIFLAIVRRTEDFPVKGNKTQEASIAGSNDFRLLTSAIMSNPLSFQFLLERNYWQQDAYGNISCVFRQTSGQTSSGTANGLEAVYSPYFYITKEVSNLSKIIKPFLSYIWSENILIVLPVFKERDETAKNI